MTRTHFTTFVSVVSLGIAFQRAWELKEEISAFLEMMRKFDAFPELSDKNFLCGFVFTVDIFSYMNEMKVRLHWKDQFVHDFEKIEMPLRLVSCYKTRKQHRRSCSGIGRSSV